MICKSSVKNGNDKPSNLFKRLSRIYDEKTALDTYYAVKDNTFSAAFGNWMYNAKHGNNSKAVDEQGEPIPFWISDSVVGHVGIVRLSTEPTEDTDSQVVFLYDKEFDNTNIQESYEVDSNDLVYADYLAPNSLVLNEEGEVVEVANEEGVKYKRPAPSKTARNTQFLERNFSKHLSEVLDKHPSKLPFVVDTTGNSPFTIKEGTVIINPAYILRDDTLTKYGTGIIDLLREVHTSDEFEDILTTGVEALFTSSFFRRVFNNIKTSNKQEMLEELLSIAINNTKTKLLFDSDVDYNAFAAWKNLTINRLYKSINKVGRGNDVSLIKIFEDEAAIKTLKLKLAAHEEGIDTQVSARATNSTVDYLTDKRTKLQALINEYDDSSKASVFTAATKKTYKALTKLLREYEISKDKSNLFEALMLTAESDASTIEQMNRLMLDLQTKFLHTPNNEFTDDMKRELADQLNNIRLFIASYDNVEMLTDYSKTLNNKDENDKKILSLIKEIKEMKAKALQIQSSYDALETKWIDTVLEVLRKRGVVIPQAKQFLDEMVDINWSMATFDGLMDSDNAFASLIKQNSDTRLREVNYKKGRLMVGFNDAIAKALGANYSNDASIALHKAITDDKGRLLQRYNQDYVDEYNTWLSLIHLSRDNAEVKAKTMDEFEQWKIDNLELEYTPEYYAIFNALKPELKDKVSELSARTKEITKYKGATYNNIDLTDKEKATIETIRKERKQLMDKYPEVAEYYKNVSNTFKQNTSSSFWLAYDKAKEQGIESENEFLVRNSEISDVLQDELNKAYKVLGTSMFRRSIKGEMKRRFGHMTDATGVFKANELSKAEIAEIGRWEQASQLYLDEETSAMVTEASTFNEQLAIIEAHGTSTATGSVPYHITKALAVIEDNTKTIESDYYTERYKEEEAKGEDNFREWFEANHYITRDGKKQALPIWTTQVAKTINHSTTKGKLNYQVNLEVNPKFVNKSYKGEDINNIPYPKDGLHDSDKFQKLDDTKKEYLAYLLDLYDNLTEHLNDPFTNLYYMPGVSTQSIIGKEDKTKRIGRDVSGQQVFDLMLKNARKIEQKPLIRLLDKLDSETTVQYEERMREHVATAYEVTIEGDLMKGIIAHNNELRKENDSHHADLVSYDGAKTIPAFIKNTLEHQARVESQGEVRLLLATIGRHTMQRELSRYDKLKSSVSKNLQGEALNDKIKGIESRLYKRILKDYEMVLGEMFLDEREYDHLLRGIRTYTSLKGIGFNVFSAVKNVAYGSIMTAIEAGGRQFFDVKYLRRSNVKYGNNISNFVKDSKRTDGKADTLISAFVNVADVVNVGDELGTDNVELNDYFEGDDIAKSKFMYNRYMRKAVTIGYIGQHMGEHMMQNKTLLAMSLSHTIVDGMLMSESDFIEGRKEKAKGVYSKDKKGIATLKEVNTNNKRIVKEARAEFQDLPKIQDMLELEDGYLKIKEDSPLTSNLLARFFGKVQGVNHKIHGIYNPSDKGAVENSMFGQLVMQFRHWARPGWVKRFGTRGGWNTKEFYNVRRDEYDKGDYKVTRDFLFSAMSKDAIKQKLDKESYEWKEAIEAVLSNYADYFNNAGAHWSNLSEQDKASVIRVSGEFLSIALALFLLAGLKKLGDDDDELKDNIFYNFMIYEVDAVRSELMAYTPVVGWLNEGAKVMANPSATYGTIQGGVKLGTELVMYVLNEVTGNSEANYFKGGGYNKQLKLGVRMQQMTPAANQYFRWANLNDNNRYYKLYSVN